MEQFLVDLPFYRDIRRLQIGYRPEPMDKKQARLRGRLAIQPELELDRYTASGVVDWLEIRVQLSRRTQWKHVQIAVAPAAGRVPRVTGPNAEENYNGEVFRIRFQDPNRKKLKAVLLALEQKYGPFPDPEVLGLEVSVDFQPKSGDRDERQKMVGFLHRHFLPDSRAMTTEASPPRTVFEEGADGAKKIWVPNDLFWRPPYVDGTYCAGERGAPISWRIMDKVTDNRRPGGIAEALAPADHRARIEVTLCGPALEALGLTKLSELRRCRFETMRADFFDFRLGTVPGEVEAAEGVSLAKVIRDCRAKCETRRFKETGVYGMVRGEKELRRSMKEANQALPKAERKMEGARSKQYRMGETGTTVAFVALNEMIRQALRRVRL